MQANALDQARDEQRDLSPDGRRHGHQLRRHPRRCLVEEKGAEIFRTILDVASGKRTKSEELGYGDAEFIPWQVGAACNATSAPAILRVMSTMDAASDCLRRRSVFAIFPAAIAFAGLRHHLTVLMAKRQRHSRRHPDTSQSACEHLPCSGRQRLSFALVSKSFLWSGFPPSGTRASRPLTRAATAELTRERQMAKTHDSYYAPKSNGIFAATAASPATRPAAWSLQGLVGLRIGWLIYDRMSARAEQERREQARRDRTRRMHAGRSKK